MSDEPTIQIEYDLPELTPYEGKSTRKQKMRLWDLGFHDQGVINTLGLRQASYLIDRVQEAQQAHANKLRDRQTSGNFRVVFAIMAVILWVIVGYNIFRGAKDVAKIVGVAAAVPTIVAVLSGFGARSKIS